MPNKFYVVGGDTDYSFGPYLWTNINRKDYFSWDGAWEESFRSEEHAIAIARQRTDDGWIVDCYKQLGYTAKESKRT